MYLWICGFDIFTQLLFLPNVGFQLSLVYYQISLLMLCSGIIKQCFKFAGNPFDQLISWILNHLSRKYGIIVTYVCDMSWHIMWHVMCDFIAPGASYGSLASGTIEQFRIRPFLRELLHFSQKVYQTWTSWVKFLVNLLCEKTRKWV